MVPKSRKSERGNPATFGTMLNRMVPKRPLIRAKSSTSFGTMLNRMVPKPQGQENDL